MSEIAAEAPAEPVETPAPEAAEAPAPEAPAAPAFDADAARSFFGTPEGQQVLVEQLQSLIPDEPYDAAPQGPQQPEFEFDPLGDDPTGQLRQLLKAELGPILQEVIGPYAPALESAQQAQAQSWLETQFSGLPSDTRDLSFKEDSDRELAVFLANGIGSPNETVGFRGLHPDQAFQEATRRLNERDQRIASAAVEAYKAGLSGDGGQIVAEPGLGAGPAGVRTEPVPNGVREAADQFRARRGY